MASQLVWTYRHNWALIFLLYTVDEIEQPTGLEQQPAKSGETHEEGAPNSWHLIRGIVTLAGVFDLRPLVRTYVNEPLKLTK